MLWHLGDQLGGTRDLVDNTGVLATHYKLDSFGNIKSGDTSKTRYIYTNQEYDPDTGLWYFNERWYDPVLGRFISEDPNPAGTFAEGANNVAYVHNGPVNATDPTGWDTSVVIYIDPTDAPSNFHLGRVSQQLHKILDDANIKHRVSIVQTTSKPKLLPLGWLFDRKSYFGSTGWYNLNPLQWVVNSAHDLHACMFKKVLSYNHHIRFVNATTGIYSAITKGSETDINTAKTYSTSDPDANADIAYANVIFHEVFWLGAMGEFDDPSADRGSFPSGHASNKKLIKLSDGEVTRLKELLGTSGK